MSLMLMAGPAIADDGTLLRKRMSSSAGSVENPVSEAEHAFINYMTRYVPAQTSSGVLTTVDYFNIDGALVKTEPVARPLIGVYIYGPAHHAEGTGFVGNGQRDAFAAVSFDDGTTWKRTNLSDSADQDVSIGGTSAAQTSAVAQAPGIDAEDDDDEDTDSDSDSDDDDDDDPNGAAVIDEAEWHPRNNGGRLSVHGRAGSRDRVEIINADTLDRLFTVRAKGSGEFEKTKGLAEAPCRVAAVVDGIAGPPTDVDGAPETCAGGAGTLPWHGDVINVFHAVAGDYVVVAWPSRFCTTGSPGYAMDDTARTAVATYLGIDNTADMYLTDLFGVAGSQGSSDLAEEGYPEVGEVPFSCLWTARGVLQPDPTAPGTSEIRWFKPERLTSGKRDVNRIEIRMVAGAGAAITWQEDPAGIRPGQGEGPGEGWSGAIAHNQTDVWYSFLPWDHFDVVDDNGTPVQVALYTGTTQPKHYVPFALPMRLTNNAKCTYPVANETDEYCNNAIAANYGIDDRCAASVDIPTGQQGTLSPICVDAAGLPNVANTAATRPRLSLQARDRNGDGITDSAWVVVVSEEDKGMGRYFFLPDGTPCTEGAVDCVESDVGKNIWYYSFDMGTPQTSADLTDTGLVKSLVSQGNILNQPETDWRTGAFYPALSTANMWNFGVYDFFIHRTEIARRGSLLVQSIAKADASTSGLVALPAWKQGLLNQGGPADVMARRIVNGTNAVTDNPYDFRNMPCTTWAVSPGTNPYYPHGMCADPAINISGTTPRTCEVSGTSDGVCPTLVNGVAAEDPENQQLFDKMLTWFQCPGSSLCGTTPESTVLGSNLDDQSWHNPLDIAKGHRGFLDGDFVMLLYAWSPNYKLNRVGHDRYELYTRRSFDGGASWTTTPGAWGGVGTTTCETWRTGANVPSTDEEHVCTTYAAGAPEQARNVSQLRSMQFTILDPRYAATKADITPSSIVGTDTRDPSRFFLVYETGDNTTVTEGEAEPLDLFYGRAVAYGDHFQVWAEESGLDVCYPNDPHGVLPTDGTDARVGSGFCNEFDDLEGRRDTRSSEASVVATPAGDFMYGVWAQWAHDASGELTESDAMVRRVWFIDNYISTTNAWTLPGTQGTQP